MTLRRINMRRAFTLTEILVSLSLLVLFFAAAGEVFKSTVILSSDAPRISDESNRIDSAIFQLRRDVWSSPQINVSSPKSANLDSPDGKISWSIAPGGDIIRTDSRGQSERWNAIARTWSLAAGATCLMISDGSAEMRLPSQILLTRGAQP